MKLSHMGQLFQIILGIQIINYNFDIIIPSGTVLPLRNQNLLKFSKVYKNKMYNSKQLIIKIYEGNNQKVENNDYLGKLIVDINENEEIIKISMSIDNNGILSVSASFDNDKNKRNKTTLFLNE